MTKEPMYEPIFPAGKSETAARTAFDNQKLYDLLLTIPRGRVVTYGKLAEMLGNKNLARAVGNALHKNPDGDQYPCCKVVNSRGELSRAYAFGGIDEQKRRLEAEGIVVENGKVDLEEYGYELCLRRSSKSTQKEGF